ncbi:TRAP transporter small permease [Parasalinivibrio latis]|uniref:TRAP transporter small permease n=1 Tax=Parasalinivibrio latis TaxID=2952610 RepID=UPI0030E01C67
MSYKSKLSPHSYQSSLLKLIDFLDEVVTKIFSLLTVLSLAALCGVVLLQVFARTFLENTPPWTEELSRYFFIYTVAFGVGIAFKKGELVSVDIILSKLKEKHRVSFMLIINIAQSFFIITIIPYALQYMKIGGWQTSPVLAIPMNTIFFASVLILSNLLFFITLDIIRRLYILYNWKDS